MDGWMHEQFVTNFVKLNTQQVTQFRDLYYPPTSRKFNIAPKNRPFQKESSLPTTIFQGLC